MQPKVIMCPADTVNVGKPPASKLGSIDSCVRQPGSECKKGMVTTNTLMNTDL